MSIDPVQAVIVLGPLSNVREAAPARSASASSSAAPQTPAPEAMPAVRQFQVNASFGRDNRIIYRILDKQTGDLIQQIPPEQLLEIARGIQELLQAQQTRPTLDVQS